MTMPTFTDATVVHQASLNSLSTGVNNLSLLMTGVPAPRTYIPTSAAFINTNHSIPNSTDTIVTLDQAFSAVVNNDNMWVAGQNAFTIQTGGVYIAYAQLHFDLNATGVRALHILLNGTAVSNSVAAASDNALNVGEGNAFSARTPPMALAPGATLYLSAYQNSGGALNLTTVLSGTYMSVIRVGN